MPLPIPIQKSWDIFCRVIDNYGDIGVCWRLARQLAAERNQQVRLWVDELEALVRIWPDAQLIDQQTLAGVDVCRWPTDFPADITTGDVVIEAFACDIPSSYLQKMAEAKQAGQTPVWINLEYLSAETWVEDCHKMVSIHPSTGLRKTFFFPGFTPKTGGLLRESELLQQRDPFDRTALFRRLGINPAPNSLVISLFAYENQAVGSLLSAWATSNEPVCCLVPEGKILASINQALGSSLQQGDVYTNGSLTLKVIPFLTHLEYDQLLWACNINFVRGEDSFVRAQWAAKPFVWHIYQQDEDAHLVKLNAFLDHFCSTLNDQLSADLRALWLDWNCQTDMAEVWQRLISKLPDWALASSNWSDNLAQIPDLACQLDTYCDSLLAQKSTTEKQQTTV